MSEWYEIDANCTNCGKPLRARWGKVKYGFVLSGASPVDVSHADGTDECVIIRKPACYDIWTANRELKKSQRQALENEAPEEGEG